MYCGSGLDFFIPSPRRYQFLHNTLSPVNVMFFWFNTLKGTQKVPAVNLLKLHNLRGIKTAFLTPKIGYSRNSYLLSKNYYIVHSWLRWLKTVSCT